MEIVVPVDGFARHVAAASAAYLRANPKGVLRAPLSVSEAGQLVKAMVSDKLSKVLHWAQNSDDELEAACRLIVPAYDCESTKRIHRIFYTEVLAEIEEHVSSMITTAIGSDGWRIWTTRPIAVQYQRYQEDIPAIADEDMVAIGRHVGRGLNECRIIRRGEPLLDVDGKQLFKCRKGELILDPTTKAPIPDEHAEGTLDLILERGEDFRVYEWERMLRENVISYSHFTANEYDLLKEEVKEEFEELVHTPTERAIMDQLQRRITQVIPNRPTIAGAGVPKRQSGVLLFTDPRNFILYNAHEQRQHESR